MAHMYKLPCRCFRPTSVIVNVLHLPITCLHCNFEIMLTIETVVVEIPLIQLFMSK